MIVGIGTDIVKISRIRESLDRLGERFAERILAASELERFRATTRPERYLAKRFSAKEAAAKALGCGIGEGANWSDIVVENNSAGAPRLRFDGNAARTAAALGVTAIHVSISDEHDYAVAFVVLS